VTTSAENSASKNGKNGEVCVDQGKTLESRTKRSFLLRKIWFFKAIPSILKNERLIWLRKISRKQNERSILKASV
jgi:hypothetical protein